MSTKAFCEEAVAYHKVQEYKNKLQDYHTLMLNRLTWNAKHGFAFSINPFSVNGVSDCCPVHSVFVTNLSSVEMKLTEMQEDLAW